MDRLKLNSSRVFVLGICLALTGLALSFYIIMTLKLGLGSGNSFTELQALSLILILFMLCFWVIIGGTVAVFITKKRLAAWVAFAGSLGVMGIRLFLFIVRDSRPHGSAAHGLLSGFTPVDWGVHLVLPALVILVLFSMLRENSGFNAEAQKS